MGAELREEEWQLLHQRLRGIAKRRAALDAEEARCLREADGSRLWRRFGYVQMHEYLERELGYGPQVGIERLRIAHALGKLPLLEASLAEGTLPYSAVRELTRVATGETERAWLDRVRGKNLRQIEALVSGKKPGDGPEDPTDPDLVNRVVRLELAPAVFALFRQAQSALADEHGGRLDDSAFMELLCRRALEGDGASERPAYQIAMTICESCERGWQNGAGREVEVGPEVIDRARCDAEQIGSFEAEQPARVTATVTPRIRRQVLARDRHRCTAPGCRSARNLDLHHIEYQRDGGAHQLWNMTVLCSGHHQQLHEGALTIRGKAPHELEFVWRAPREGRAAVASAHPHVGADTKVEQGIVMRAPREDRAAVANASPHVGADTKVEQGIVMRAPREDRATVANARPTVANARPHVGVDTRVEQGVVIRESLAGDTRAEVIDHNAREALVTCGYKSREARVAVELARSHVEADATLAQVIREALQRCALPSSLAR